MSAKGQPTSAQKRAAYKRGYRVGLREGNAGQSTPGMGGGTPSPYAFGTVLGAEWTRGFQAGVARHVSLATLREATTGDLLLELATRGVCGRVATAPPGGGVAGYVECHGPAKWLAAVGAKVDRRRRQKARGA